MGEMADMVNDQGFWAEADLEREFQTRSGVQLPKSEREVFGEMMTEDEDFAHATRAEMEDLWNCIYDH